MSYIHVHTYVMYGTAAACTTNKNVCTRRGTYNIYFMSHTGTVSGIHTTHVCMYMMYICICTHTCINTCAHLMIIGFVCTHVHTCSM